ncbi:hypothetical protein VEIDISOL_01080 [Veillonella dispar ATCC 17748]|uniref:Uncharacterized protein n=1 Tax=Veillonella dispar ATCC 17748 TaxID=546273 RepID=C4FQL2_9FIRM|nr:hypothetical protein [Veillonella dispar]EEP65205.1 hypothetical protein VEIDISOL_01080 [Veillonella dispar ATCC 17748]VEG93499.1 Uncharacterised protein [Veillonella dispar]
MAIQDLINEVNSIQSKKQAIKEAITAKGVTSEGKLSKFADEIKQITTKEPDWYIVNKFRYDNGNEALYVRTSDKTAVYADKYQMVEIGGGVTRSNSISNSFNSYYNDDLGITNGTYFPRETAYRSFTTKDSSSVVFDGHNDNLKLTFNNGKDIVFNDVNAYNWLKGYRNQPLADFNTLYLKSDGINNEGTAKTLKDFLASSNETRMSTLGEYGQNPLLLIDSSIMIQAMNLRKMPKTGFIYYSDKTVDAVSLIPVLYTNTNSDIPFYENKEQLYGNLSPGNYIHLYVNNSFLLIVFVSINFVVDSNNQKHKNIEVYIYNIVKENKNNIDFFKLIDKPFELYLTFSNKTQQQLQQASNTKVFRNKVLEANGTPEARASNFLTGSDALLEVSASKITNGRLPVRNTTANLFKKNSRADNIFRYQTSIFEGGYIATSLVEDIRLNKKIAGFIHLNDDSNTMFPIELEKVPDEIKNNPKISYYRQYGYFSSCIAPNGILPERNNKMMVFVKDIQGDITCFYVKKGNDYITNDMLSTNPKNTQLYITSDTESQQYLTTKPLSNIWTEINSLNKDDFEAYSEE